MKKYIVSVIFLLTVLGGGMNASFLFHDIGYANHFGMFGHHATFSMYENPALMESNFAAYGSFSRRYGFSELDETAVAVEFSQGTFSYGLYAYTFQALPYQEQEAGICINKKMLPAITIGITIKALRLTAVENAYTAFSYDIGFSSRYKNHTLALSVKDIEKPMLNERIAMTSIAKYEYCTTGFTFSMKYVSISSLYDHWLLGCDYAINKWIAASYAFRLKNGEHRAGLRFTQNKFFINIGYTLPAELDGYLFSEAGIRW